jgi:hypothetical protein
MKVVVFDLDETLGYFVEFGVFWDCLATNNIKKKSMNEDFFHKVFDLYPEFLRPNIMEILNYLKTKKESLKCHQLMIYTNNQGPSSWANQIISYFESKIKFRLIDKIIAAFKINGKRVEMTRTTHDKTYDDLMKCTRLPSNAEIFFLDDVYHPEMCNKNVYYINIKPYIHGLSFKTMLIRFIKSDVGDCFLEKQNVNEFKNNMINRMSLYHLTIEDKNEKDYTIDKILGKKIMSHLEDFFKS